MHWMLSYSVNDTFREDEIFWAEDFGQGAYHNVDGRLNYNHGGGLDIIDHYEVRPPYGSLAAGSGVRPSKLDCEEKQPKSR